MGKPIALVQGTLDLLILNVLSLEPKHGWAIAKRIQQVSREALRPASSERWTRSFDSISINRLPKTSPPV